MPFTDYLRQGARGLGKIAPIAGAGIGAFAGGPPGAAAGLGVGSSIGSLLGYLGEQPGQQTTSPFEGVDQQILQGYLQQPNLPFEDIAGAEISRYQQDILPQLASQFGGRGLQGSSGFLRQLRSSGEGLSERLASLRSQHGLQQRGQQLQALGGLGGFVGSERGRQLQELLGKQQLGLQAAGQQYSGLGQALAPGLEAGFRQQGAGLGQQFTPSYRPATPGLAQTAAGPLLGAAGQGLSSLAALR